MNKKERRAKYRELWAFETVDTKACSKCLTIKSLDEFYPHQSCRKGRQAECRLCHLHRYWGVSKNTEYLILRNKEKDTEKVCVRCLKILSLTDYHKQPSARKKVQPMCKVCRRHLALEKDYGLTIGDYNTLLEAQDGRCKICGTTKPGGHGNRFAVDHAHETGEVRGLLCQQCNCALGHFKDNPDLLRKAAEYLESKVTV